LKPLWGSIAMSSKKWNTKNELIRDSKSIVMNFIIKGIAKYF
jgi:hypothetical protein